MQQSQLMELKILLPFQIFADVSAVSRIVADGEQGSFGLLPHRLDCVTAIVPGILIYESESQKEVYVAVDEGVLVKTGLQVTVSVRNAIGGADLSHLHEVVDRQFLALNQQEKNDRTTMKKMESKLVHGLVEFQHE